jgi:hypothetical protein
MLIAAHNDLQRFAVERTRLGIPLSMSCGQMLGQTTLPSGLACAATFDVAAIAEGTRAKVEELRTVSRSYGIGHPTCDLALDPRWSRVEQTFGEDPFLSVDNAYADFRGNVWTGSFEKGQKVTITAKPADGYVFAGWSGAVSSDFATITVTADKAVSLICNFKAEYEHGDINMDGTVNAADLLLMSKYLRGVEDFTKAQFTLADMNGDKSADIFDLVCLRKELLK